MNRVINIILTHQHASAVARMLAFWSDCVPRESILIAYGGKTAEFEAIEHAQKFFVHDPRLRTRDHQREYQSYSGLYRGAAELLREKSVDFEFVHFAEYDHLPLVVDLNERQVEHLCSEDADVLGYHLQRIDGTSHPHFLYHVRRPEFAAHWSSITRRSDPGVVLSMMGTGNFWTWEAFREVAAADEPFPIYMEIYLPTLAHHLGFRLRGFAAQNQFVHPLGDRTRQMAEARAAGAWTLHPVKRLWSQ